jgi:hypothetical protein
MKLNYHLRTANYALRWLLLLTALLILNSVFLIQPGTAAGVTISPPFREVVLQPDRPTAQFNLTVRNDTAVTQAFRLTVQDFGSLDESGGVAFLGTKASDLEYKYGLAGWLIPGTDSISLEPGQTRKVNLTIENRSSLTPGGHYAAVLLTSQSSPENGQKPRVVIKQVLSSLVLVKKVGGEVYGLALDRIEVASNLLKPPDKLKLRFQNSGNVHVVPRGTVELKDPRGHIVNKGLINPESTWILPESFRLYSSSLRQTNAAWLPGRYTLEVKYRYDGKADFETSSRTFFHLGRLGVIGLIAIAVALTSAALIAFSLRRRKARRAP